MNKTIKNIYTQMTFLKSASCVTQLPQDSGFEVAFAGRSNAGKSSALNTLIGRQIARTSKTPGRTQLLNVFSFENEPSHRLIDLPGYGYAKVALKTKQDWQLMLANYLEVRQSLRGLILLMDIRHPLKELDQTLIHWSIRREIPIHILLTKADKISRGEAKSTLLQVEKYGLRWGHLFSAQIFSSLKKQGVEELMTQLNIWLEKTCHN